MEQIKDVLIFMITLGQVVDLLRFINLVQYQSPIIWISHLIHMRNFSVQFLEHSIFVLRSDRLLDPSNPVS